jgi:hypothetical protein
MSAPNHPAPNAAEHGASDFAAIQAGVAASANSVHDPVQEWA